MTSYPATAGNNRRVHLVRETHDDYNLTVCGVRTPRRPQTTQEPLPNCRRCF
jgi:hypothetical protein